MESELNLNGHNGNGNGNGNGHRVSALRPTTLRDLLAIGFRHRRLIRNAFLGIVAGAILVAVLQPRQYKAGMKILVKRERVDPVVTSEAAVQPQFATGVTEEELNSEVELLKSRDLLEQIVRECNLAGRQSHGAWSRMLEAFGVREQTIPEQTAQQVARATVKLQKELNVEVLKKTDLIAVSYESRDPQLAAHVLSTLANLYLEKHVAVHRPPGEFDFFRHEAERYRKGLSEAEAQLVSFTRDGTVISAQYQKDVALQKLADFDANLRETEAGIAETEKRIAILQKEADVIPVRVVTEVRKSDDGGLLSQLRNNLLTLELKRTELLQKFEPSYRPVQDIQAEIDQTRASLAEAERSQLQEETTNRDPTFEWVTQELAKAKADLAGLKARAQATTGTVRFYEQNAQTLGQKEIAQNDLVRTVKATEQDYLLYLQKAEEARMSDALDRKRILNVAIAEPAAVPLLPSNHRSLTVLLGVLLAIGTSLGLALGSEYLDPTFRTPEEVSTFLNIPVLATLPKNGKNGTAKSISPVL
jgi:uncharacterized protein involved in exopolysaccharide biosynthesis